MIKIFATHADMCFSKITKTHSKYCWNDTNFFEDLFESIPDCRIILGIKTLIKNYVDILQECAFLNDDINRLCLEIKKLLLQENEEHLNYIKKEEEPIIEKILNK